MRVLITGATGLIGSNLIVKLQSMGYEVAFLTTSKNKLDSLDGCKGYYWNPSTGEVDVNCLDGVAIIYNLAGSSINDSWSKEGKELIIQSRINSSTTLYELLKNNKHEVYQVISASAIGIYETVNRIQDEENYKVANNFLGKVVDEWEKFNSRFEELQIKTTIVRVGLVLDRKGGALAEMEKIAKKGVLSILGSGKQYYSWIHITDLIHVFTFVLERKLNGIFNAVAPTPETNRDFTKVLAVVMDTKVYLPAVPSWLLRLVLGEKAMLVTKGQLVSCSKLLKHDFHFQYPTLDLALRELFSN